MTCKPAIFSTCVALAMACGGAHAQSASPLPGFADPVLGRWDLTVEGPDGPYPSWLEVRLRTETQLMGRLVGRFGSVRHATGVDFADGRLSVVVPPQYEGGDADLVFTGELEDGTLVGKFSMGDGRKLDWRGVRAPALKRNSSVVWDEARPLIGENLAGWRPRDDRHPGCWAVVDGVLKATPPCVDLITEPEFDDFRLQLEFRYPPGSNSGIYLRGRYEVQIQDDIGKPPDPLRMGGVYGFLYPVVDAARPAGEWQTYDITLIGRRVTVILNGIEVVSDRVIPGITGGALDSREGHSGPLMLQGDHGPIEFRNIVVTPAGQPH